MSSMSLYQRLTRPRVLPWSLAFLGAIGFFCIRPLYLAATSTLSWTDCFGVPSTQIAMGNFIFSWVLSVCVVSVSLRLMFLRLHLWIGLSATGGAAILLMRFGLLSDGYYRSTVYAMVSSAIAIMWLTLGIGTDSSRCSNCGGTGLWRFTDMNGNPSTSTCGACGGSGVISADQNTLVRSVLFLPLILLFAYLAWRAFPSN